MNSLKDLKNISQDYTVLYVEDDTNIANTLISYLSKFFKEVVYAKNGEEGLQLYNQDLYDIVISDINMPKMNGLEMSKEIKRINNDQNIIIISAYSEVEDFLTSIKIGVDGYIIKPVDYKEINNLLFKTVTKIKATKDNELLKKEQEEFLSILSRNNNQLQQFTNVIDKIAIVSKTDLQGNIIYVNDLFVDISGYTKNELIGQNHNIIRHNDMSKSLYQKLWEDIQSGQIWEGTIKNKAKDQSAYFVHAVIIPLFDVNKEIQEYISINFLTTKEELQKREFKKRVMTNYIEFKKTNMNAVEIIGEKDKEVEKLKEENKLLKQKQIMAQEKFDKINTKYKRANSQIRFYEKGSKEKDGQYHKIFEIQKSNLNKISESHKISLMKIEAQNKELDKLKEEHELKGQQIINLNEKLNEQTNIILDLRDTIKNINEELEKK